MQSTHRLRFSEGWSRPRDLLQANGCQYHHSCCSCQWLCTNREFSEVNWWVQGSNEWNLQDIRSRSHTLATRYQGDSGPPKPLSQHMYIDSIILQYNFTNLKPSAIPMDPSTPLLKLQSPTKLADITRMKNIPYQEAVGSLMYAAMETHYRVCHVDGSSVLR